jgi:hypothetical protein
MMLALILRRQPLKRLELLSIQMWNIATTTCGVLIKQGLVVLVTNYHKSYSIKTSCKLIHRYLP